MLNSRSQVRLNTDTIRCLEESHGKVLLSVTRLRVNH